MTPQELRIGNRVNYEQTDHVIDQILSHTVIHRWLAGGAGPIGAAFYTSYSDLTPIPLDKKELLRMGFIELEENHFSLSYQELLFDYEHDKLTFSNGYWTMLSSNLMHIRFVHQFQNLYFALTGTEI